MTPGIKKEHPQGMVLMFVLGILALLIILGSTIFMTTKDEVQISGENFGSRDAFIKADLTARLTVYLARTSLYGSPGDTSESLAVGGVAGSPEFAIKLHDNFSSSGFMDIGDKVSDPQIKDRYLLAADGLAGETPHVQVFYQYDNTPSARQLVGTSAVAVGTSSSDAVGSQGEGQYDPISTGGYSVRVYLVVSANGRVPLRNSGGTLEVDPANYFTGVENAKHSVVTTIYQEVIQ